MHTFTIDADTLRALFASAADETDSRFYLRSVCLSNGKLTATNGQMLFQVPASVATNVTNPLIAGPVILRLPEKSISARADTVTVTVKLSTEEVLWEEHSKTGKLIRAQGSYVIVAEYLDVDKVLPERWFDTPAKDETFAFNPGLFSRVTEHFPHDVFRLRFPHEAGKPYRMEFQGRPDWLLVVMPMVWR